MAREAGPVTMCCPCGSSPRGGRRLAWKSAPGVRGARAPAHLASAHSGVTGSFQFLGRPTWKARSAICGATICASGAFLRMGPGNLLRCGLRACKGDTINGGLWVAQGKETGSHMERHREPGDLTGTWEWPGRPVHRAAKDRAARRLLAATYLDKSLPPPYDPEGTTVIPWLTCMIWWRLLLHAAAGHQGHSMLGGPRHGSGYAGWWARP